MVVSGIETEKHISLELGSEVEEKRIKKTNEILILKENEELRK